MYRSCPLISNRQCQGCSLSGRLQSTASVPCFASPAARNSPLTVLQIIWLVPLGSPSDQLPQLHPSTLIRRGRESCDWMLNTAKVKVLVIATQKTALAGRISIALADVGFRVAALTPHGHPVRRTRTIQDSFACHARPQLNSIIRAIERWSPDRLA